MGKWAVTLGDALFGRYWAEDSIVHGLAAPTKLCCTLVWIIACFCAETPLAIGVLCCAFVLFVIASRIPLGQVLRSVAPLMFIVLISALINLFTTQTGNALVDWGWLRITDDGVSRALFVTVRLTLLLLGGSLLTLTTTTLDITAAFEKVLSPLARFGVPAHEFALVMGIALRFVPQFVGEFRVIRTAQVARGARLSTSPTAHGLAGVTSLLVPLLASAFRHADTLANAMEARCYHGAEGKTSLHVMKFRVSDGVAIALLVALVAVCIVVSRL